MNKPDFCCALCTEFLFFHFTQTFPYKRRTLGRAELSEVKRAFCRRRRGEKGRQGRGADTAAGERIKLLHSKALTVRKRSDVPVKKNSKESTPETVKKTPVSGHGERTEMISSPSEKELHFTEKSQLPSKEQFKVFSQDVINDKSSLSGTFPLFCLGNKFPPCR